VIEERDLPSLTHQEGGQECPRSFGLLRAALRLAHGSARVAGMNPQSYFERRTSVCGGALVIKDTRVPVRTLLASLAEGASAAEILKDFPTVSETALRAVIAFAAAAAVDDMPTPGVPLAA
jgi:uncharacterized protein (DUF433 family)